VSIVHEPHACKCTLILPIQYTEKSSDFHSRNWSQSRAAGARRWRRRNGGSKCIDCFREFYAAPLSRKDRRRGIARPRRSKFWGYASRLGSTDCTAIKLADERANTAVVAALTPVCAEKFLQNGDAKANLAVLQKISTPWEQGDYLEKGGWATRPGATFPDYQLARACAEKLVQLGARRIG
jgi:hypothetical protein